MEVSLKWPSHVSGTEKAELELHLDNWLGSEMLLGISRKGRGSVNTDGHESSALLDGLGNEKSRGSRGGGAGNKIVEWDKCRP